MNSGQKIGNYTVLRIKKVFGFYPFRAENDPNTA